MVTTVIRGGLGNQLFQYASAYALAKRLDQPLTLDISFYPKQKLRGYKLDKLNLQKHDVSIGKYDGLLMRAYKNKNVNGLIRRSPFKTMPIKKGKYLVDHAGSFTPYFFSIDSDNIFLNGYFQSEEYFRDVRRELLIQLTPSYEVEQEYTCVLDDIKAVNSVALHVRHGDFSAGNDKGYHYVVDKEYYKHAVRIIKQIVEKPFFFCFSDDIEWVRENIRGLDDFRFVSLHTAHPDIDEMMLMKNCKHIITANSTFSWWAAWLNENKEAIRIVPDRAYGNDHMIPASWTKVKVE